MEEFLIVDGYNIIGAWPELRELKMKGELDLARETLVDWLNEYQAYSGKRVILVFDAHFVPGSGKKYKNKRITVYYTKENESADERIEKLVADLHHRKRQIYVATSDYTEQRVIFGQGALRISARELAIEKENTQKLIKNKVVEENRSSKKTVASLLDDEIIKIFENWRRNK